MRRVWCVSGHLHRFLGIHFEFHYVHRDRKLIASFVAPISAGFSAVGHRQRPLTAVTAAAVFVCAGPITRFYGVFSAFPTFIPFNFEIYALSAMLRSRLWVLCDQKLCKLHAAALNVMSACISTLYPLSAGCFYHFCEGLFPLFWHQHVYTDAWIPYNVFSSTFGLSTPQKPRFVVLPAAADLPTAFSDSTAFSTSMLFTRIFAFSRPAATPIALPVFSPSEWCVVTAQSRLATPRTRKYKKIHGNRDACSCCAVPFGVLCGRFCGRNSVSPRSGQEDGPVLHRARRRPHHAPALLGGVLQTRLYVFCFFLSFPFALHFSVTFCGFEVFGAVPGVVGVIARVTLVSGSGFDVGLGCLWVRVEGEKSMFELCVRLSVQVFVCRARFGAHFLWSGIFGACTSVSECYERVLSCQFLVPFVGVVIFCRKFCLSFLSSSCAVCSLCFCSSAPSPY